MNYRVCRIGVVPLIAIFLLTGCTAKQPQNIDDICAVFDQQKSWYKAAGKSARRWGAPIPVMLAIIHQESSFKARAKPPRKKILWIIPGPRPASAKGYAQAIDGTWNMYKKATGRWAADRNSFKDAVDFIGWYIDQSSKRNRIAKDDTYNLYLSYHEGHGGFAKGTYRNKQWLKNVASKVAARSNSYSQQLSKCEKKHKKRFFGLF